MKSSLIRILLNPQGKKVCLSFLLTFCLAGGLLAAQPEVATPSVVASTPVTMVASTAPEAVPGLTLAELANFTHIQASFDGMHGFKWRLEDQNEPPVWYKVDFHFPGFSLRDDMGRGVTFPIEWKGNAFSLLASGTSDDINLFGHGRNFPGKYRLEASGTFHLASMTIETAGFSWSVESDDGRNIITFLFQATDVPIALAYSTPGQSLKFSLMGPGLVKHVSGASGLFQLSDWRMGKYHATDWQGTQPGSLRGSKTPPSLTIVLMSSGK